MNKDTIRRQIGQINDAADMLEIALKNAQEMLQDDACPKPWERWDEASEDAGFAAGEINNGDFGDKISTVIDALHLLVKEIE